MTTGGSTATTTSSSFPAPDFIEPEAVRDLIIGGDNKKDKIQVVDVRGSDFKGGKLPNAINVPTDDFKEDARVDALVKELKDKEMVVLHCGQSKQRGPFCAGRFLSRLNAQAQEEGVKLPQVTVLRGGFEEWNRLYHEEEGLVVPIDEKEASKEG